MRIAEEERWALRGAGRMCESWLALAGIKPVLETTDISDGATVSLNQTVDGGYRSRVMAAPAQCSIHMKPIVEILSDIYRSAEDEVFPGSNVQPKDAEEIPGLHWVENAEFLLDEEGRILECNPAASSWLGQEVAELRGRMLSELLEARSVEWKRVLTELGSATGTFAQCGMCEDTSGESYWFEVNSIRSPGHRALRIRSMLSGLTELSEGAWDSKIHREGVLRQLYYRMLRAESSLRRLASSWPGVVFIQKADLSFDYVSERIAMLTGIPATAWRNDPHRFLKVVHEADQEEVRSHLRDAVKTRQLTTTTFRIRNERTGRVSHVLEMRHALVSAEGLVLGYEGAWIDVTRQMVAERRLAGAAWKETLAVVTMGQAHDFGNILSGIHSLSDSYLTAIDSGHPFHEGLGLIKQNSMLAITLVRRIVNLHRENIGHKSYSDLCEIVRESTELMRAIVNRRVKIDVEVPAGQMPIYVDEVELKQVVFNLIRNASDAMPNGGDLLVHVSRHSSFPEPGFIQGTAPRLPALCLTVRDTGTGIPRDRFPRIFDAFFTTKGLQQGSGLGLYNATLFVEKHRGAITVESEEGKGSTFKVWLPEADFSEADQGLSEAPAALRGVLLVGGEGPRTDSLAELLRLHGYAVVIAASAEEAGEIFVSPDYSIHAILGILQQAASPLGRFMELVKTHRPDVVVAAHLIGVHPEELSMSLSTSVDLFVGADGTQGEIVKGFEGAFERMGGIRR